MAYAIDNPLSKVAQMGAVNSLWYYTDGDATSVIVGSGYFNLALLFHLLQVQQLLLQQN